MVIYTTYRTVNVTPDAEAVKAYEARKVKKSAHRRSFFPRCSGRVSLAGAVLRVPEQQRDAPQSGKAHQCVDDSGKDCGLAAKEESDRIETENADTAPVQGTYDHQYQRDLWTIMSETSCLGLICGYIAQGRNIYARCRHWTA